MDKSTKKSINRLLSFKKSLHWTLIPLLLLMLGCVSGCNLVLKEQTLYEEGEHLLTTTRIEHGDFKAKAISRARIASTYPIHLYSPEIEESDEHVWTLSSDLSQLPDYQSQALIFQAVYNLALEQAENMKDDKGLFTEDINGKQLSTAELSYAILLGLGSAYPDAARKSLVEQVQAGLIKKDEGPAGGWPLTNDRIAWIAAAWQMYLINGNDNWLRTAYNVSSRSIEEDLLHIYDVEQKLFRGSGSLLEPTIQSYPDWMQAVDIYQSYSLATNALYYHSLMSLGQMAERLNTGQQQRYYRIAKALKENINERFWLEDEKYYAGFLYGEVIPQADLRSNTLGNAFCILFGIADQERALQISTQLPVEDLGAPVFFPHTPNIDHYQNAASWPVIQAFWNHALAKVRNYNAYSLGLYQAIRPSVFFLSNRDFFELPNGDIGPSQKNRVSSLSSLSGSLNLIFHHVFGFEFTHQGLKIAPFLPKGLDADHRLLRYQYRDATLNIRLRGYGDQVHAIYIGSKALNEPIIPHDLVGEHQVTVVTTTVRDVAEILQDEEDLAVDTVTYLPIDPMEILEERMESGAYNLVPHQVRPDMPRYLAFENESVVWNGAESGEIFHLYRNGQRITTTERSRHLVPKLPFASYQLQLNDINGNYSFLSAPLYQIEPSRQEVVEVENFTNAQQIQREEFGYTGSGYLQLEEITNSLLEFEIEAPKTTRYRLRFRYANGSAYTGQNSGVRSVYVKDFYYESVVFPPKGLGNWNEWGYSNAIYIRLPAGRNKLSLRLEDFQKGSSFPLVLLDHLEITEVPEL